MKKRKTLHVCTACGKRSYDKHGNKAIDKGWDISCSMHSILVYADSLIFDENTKRVRGAKAVKN